MRSFVVAALAAWIAGCAAPGAGPVADGASGPRGADPVRVESSAARVPVTPFSTLNSLDPAGPWMDWPFHATKRSTRYRSVEMGGQRVVEAVAESSVSGLKHALDVDPTGRPIIEWRWRIDSTIPGADIEDRYADDSPVRIVLAFDGDHSTLPMKEQMFFERVKLLGGQDMPYATLMYVWCNRREPGSVAHNAHTTRVRKIVVESGATGVGAWRSYRRDIVADYERAYGRKPGRLIAIGVMSDSDNTRQNARGWYGDIRLLSREEAAASAPMVVSER